MLTKQTSIMIYVDEPRMVADFWIQHFGMTEVKEDFNEERSLSVELSVTDDATTHLVLFDKKVVSEMSPELNLGTPSILFSTRDLIRLRDRLMQEGLIVGDILETDDIKTFNFSDPEGNYFAVQEIEEY